MILTCLCILSRTDNDIGDKGIKDLCGALDPEVSKLSALSVLDLRGINTSQNTLLSLMYFTSFSFSVNRIGPKGAKEIGELLKKNRTITELNLSGLNHDSN